jgi:hypothetical protein
MRDMLWRKERRVESGKRQFPFSGLNKMCHTLKSVAHLKEADIFLAGLESVIKKRRKNNTHRYK